MSRNVLLTVDMQFPGKILGVFCRNVTGSALGRAIPGLGIRCGLPFLENGISHQGASGQPRTHCLRSFVIPSMSHATTIGSTSSGSQEFISGFNELEELKSANEWVQRVFRVENASKKTTRLSEMESIDEKFGGYESQLEAKIARLTTSMKHMLAHCEKFRKDKESKEKFIWCIDSRKKALRKLQSLSLERYYKIIEELDLEPLGNPHDRKNKYKSRKFKLNVPLKKKRELHDFEADRNY